VTVACVSAAFRMTVPTPTAVEAFGGISCAPLSADEKVCAETPDVKKAKNKSMKAAM
jgi:hypothetical protein